MYSCTNFNLLPHSPEDVHSIITGKLALKYAGPQIEAMQSIAKASEHRSVAEFKKVSTMCTSCVLYMYMYLVYNRYMYNRYMYMYLLYNRYMIRGFHTST